MFLKFTIKITLLISGSFILVCLLALFPHREDIIKNELKNMPKNNISNSISFKAKLDHMVNSEKLDNCDFLIVGSSMSLNNISGNLIEEKTGYKVYNIASWGLIPKQIFNLLTTIHLNKINKIVLFFNNDDFGDGEFKINYTDVGRYLYGGSLIKSYLFLKHLNMQTFYEDWKIRENFYDKDYAYQSLKFDKTGTTNLKKRGFVINSVRWNKVHDTTGFYFFHQYLIKIDSLCKSKKIEFYAVYLPVREGLKTQISKEKNNAIALSIRTKINHFYNFNSFTVSDSLFCDGTHMFNEGAEFITKHFLDSLHYNSKF